MVEQGSSCNNALLVLVGTVNGRHKRIWIDNIKEWNNLKDYSELKKSAEDRRHWMNLARLPST